MSQIIDRRLNGKNKNAPNRNRLLRRYRKQIKEAVANAISKGSIKKVTKNGIVVIPKKDITEPMITHGEGGDSERVLPGNKEFIVGDIIKKPPSSSKQGKSGEASDKGEGEDDFIFQLSREEFLDLYFEDLELPDLVRKELAELSDYKMVHAGFSSTGIPTNINIIRSLKQATARRIALKLPYQRKLTDLENKLAEELNKNNSDDKKIIDLEQQILIIKRKIKAVPFIDTFDLRYNYHIKQEFPSTRAVMFCVMDVSGSMDAKKKDIAKRFFILLYLFLTRHYKSIELVFIRHHTSAKIVEEEEFFYSRETGGTVVSSALELLAETIENKYPSSAWNIYVAQASDGDNWNADTPTCEDIVRNRILKHVQYFSYVEIMPRHHQSLWDMYKKIAEDNNNFALKSINDYTDIYPALHKLFKRKA